MKTRSVVAKTRMVLVSGEQIKRFQEFGSRMFSLGVKGFF